MRKNQFSRVIAAVLAVVMVLGMVPYTAGAEGTASAAVTGTVAGGMSGDVIATDAQGSETVYAGALVDGVYTIDLADGTYTLKFVGAEREGMLKNVVVSGNTTAPALTKTYQKLTVEKDGADGTANWVLTDNGKYEVQTSNSSSNSITMGWFKQGVDMSATDFVIETDVQAAGTNSVMLGLTLMGKNASGSAETMVFGLNNSNQSAQIRTLKANGWPGYKNVAAYDRTNFHLTIVKQGNTVTYYINGTKACSWTTADYDFAGWTETKVGLGFYRMYDVTFSDYSYAEYCTLSGSVAGGLSGNVTATNGEGTTFSFEGALASGAYSIQLAEGTYDLYFDCGSTEGLLKDVTVSGDTTAPTLPKTYQKLTVEKDGADGTANWVLTDNGKYQVQTSNSSSNSITMGWFQQGVDMSATDFVIETDVQAAGTNSVMLGLTLMGKNASGNAETAVFGLNNSNQSAQIRTLKANGWPGYKNVAAYDRTDFHLVIVKKGTALTYYIDGMQACTWTTADYDFAGWTETKVGLGFYRMYDVAFSNYYYSTNADDITAAVGNKLTVGTLPEGVTVTANGSTFTSGTFFPSGTEVVVSGMTDAYALYTVMVNGSEVPVVDGTVQFALSQQTEIQVSVSYEFPVSGTVSGVTSGTVTAVGTEHTAQIKADGAYVLALPAGTYDLYFDCGTTEGLIPGVVVAGPVTEQNLAKTYQKLLGTHVAGTNNGKWVLVDNGKYAVQTTNTSTDGITMGYFAEGVDMNTTDFVLETDVQAAGTNSVMLGLALNGTNGSYTNATIVFGLNNANTTAQLRTFYTGNDWPGNGFHSSVAYADGDRTNFHLKIVKAGDTVHYYIDGAEAATCNWGANDFNFGTWTNVKVGLGFYRSYDVTFSNYSYTSICEYTVSGTLSDGSSGIVTATDANGLEYTGSMTDGSYSIKLPNGTYKLYFDCGDTEGLIPAVTVADAAVTVPALTKTYQKLTVEKDGADGTANWVLTDNGKYEVQTSNSSSNSITMGWFKQGVDMSATDFVIETDVQAAGTNSVMLGLTLMGKNANGSAETMVFGLNNSNQSAQIRTLKANGWPGYKNVAAYDRTNFHLTIAKQGNTVTYYINGTKACSWTTADYDFAGWTETKVGLGFYRMYDVTFSNYSYTENVVSVKVNGTEKVYTSLTEAAADNAGKTIQLQGDVTEDVALAGKLILDLNGHTLTGDITGGEVWGVDSTTDDYDAPTYGKINGTIENLANGRGEKFTVPGTGKIRRYIAITEADGTSFHRIYLGITALSLQPSKVAFGYKAQFWGDDLVRSKVTGVGYNIWAEVNGQDSEPENLSTTLDKNGMELSLRVQNILSQGSEGNAAAVTTPIQATTFMDFTIGDERFTVTTDESSNTLQLMLKALDQSFGSYSADQKQVVKKMYDKFADVLESLDLTNIAAYTVEEPAA